VLDGSTDGSAEMVRSLETPYPLRLLEQQNRGLAASRNRGWQEASAPVVVFLDDDIVPEPAFLAEHAAAHRRAPDEHVALGVYPPARHGVGFLFLVLAQVWEDFFRRRAEPGHRWTYMDFADGNVSFPRRLLIESGGWDEDFAHQARRRQDWEFGVRLLRQGVRFAEYRNARGVHHFDASLATALRNRRIEAQSDIVFGSKHPDMRRHLFLARLVRTGRGRGLQQRSMRITYESPGASERIGRCALPLLGALEALGLRRQWWSLTGRLLSHSYALGVRDALPTAEQLREFIAPIAEEESSESVSVSLDQPGRLELPRGAGAVELLLCYGGEAVARVDALEPETQWDWQLLTERVLREASAPLRRAVLAAPERLDDVPPGVRPLIGLAGAESHG
jgi:hypothetical protein